MQMTDARTRKILIPIAIVALTLAAYGSVIARGGFLWDDDILLTKNRAIHASDGLKTFWFTAKSYDYLPITWTSLWLEWRLWGDSPTGYHVTNAVMHALSAVLLWALLRELGVPGALLAAAIFAVHPVCAASVAWISERKNTLSMIFYLLTLIAYIRFDARAGRRWYVLAILAFAAALLSKSSVIMAPAVLLGIVLWRRGGKIARRDIAALAPLFVLSALFAAVTIFFQKHAIGPIAARPEGFFSRLAAAGMVPWFYLYKALLPIKLIMVYPRWDVDPALPLSYVPGVVLLGCVALFFVFRRTWGKWLLAGSGYFLVTLFPVLGFFEMSFARKSLVADHLQYVSIIAPIVLVSAAGWRALSRLTGKAGKVAARVAPVAVVAVLAGLTFNYGFVFASAETMWADVLAKNPRCPEAQYEAGIRATNEGRPLEAIDHYLRAIELREDYAEAHNNLGHVYMSQGNVPRAGYHFALAVKYLPSGYRARFNLALAQYRIGATRQAAENLRKVVADAPQFPPALNNLARILAADPDDNLRSGAEAVTLARKACQMTAPSDPALADRMHTLAMAYAETGQFDLAIQTARSAADFARQVGDLEQEKEILATIALCEKNTPVRLKKPTPPVPGSASRPDAATAPASEPAD